MGKQSSRIVYRGKDHKYVIVAEGTKSLTPTVGKRFLSNKIYIEDKLVWEKLFPEKFLATGGAYGIHVYDIENQTVDVIPFYRESVRDYDTLDNATIVMLTEIGGLLIGQSNDSTDKEYFFSDDLKSFKFAFLNTGDHLYDSYTDYSRMYYTNYLTSGDEYHIVKKSDNGFEVNKIDYKRYVFPVHGKSEYIHTFEKKANNKLLLYSYNENGKLVKTETINVAENLTYDSLVKIGSSIYSVGSREKGNYPNFEREIIFGRTTENYLLYYMTIENAGYRYNISENILSMSSDECILITDSKVSDLRKIISIKENGVSLKNVIPNGYIQVKTNEKENVNLCFDITDNTPFPKFLISGFNNRSVYIKNNKTFNTSDNGCFYTGSLYTSLTKYIYADAYFDNPYFLESDNNCIYILNLGGHK